MTSSQIKKKRKRKGLDLEAPEVITFQSNGIFYMTFPQLDLVFMTVIMTMMRERNVTSVPGGIPYFNFKFNH